MTPPPITEPPGKPACPAVRGGSDVELSKCDRWQPPAWDRRLFWTVLLVAAALAPLLVIANTSSRCVLIVYGLTYLLGCWKTKRAMHCVISGLHLPNVWIPLSYPADSLARSQAAQSFWVLPGRIPASMLPDDWGAWEPLVASLATLAIFFVGVMLARPSRRAAVITLTCLFVLSLLSSF